MKVEDVMSKDVRTCGPDDALSEAARIMWERDCGCVPVLDGDGSGRVVAMITDRDISMAAYTQGARLAEIPVRKAMSAAVRACRPGDSVDDAEALMRRFQIRRLPVVDDAGHLLGILSLADLAEAAASGRGGRRGVSEAQVAETLEAICRPHKSLVVPVAPGAGERPTRGRQSAR
jgi:CBS domain-containing protein